jgi:hypothetical protein
LEAIGSGADQAPLLLFSLVFWDLFRDIIILTGRSSKIGSSALSGMKLFPVRNGRALKSQGVANEI